MGWQAGKHQTPEHTQKLVEARARAKRRKDAIADIRADIDYAVGRRDWATALRLHNEREALEAADMMLSVLDGGGK